MYFEEFEIGNCFKYRFYSWALKRILDCIVLPVQLYCLWSQQCCNLYQGNTHWSQNPSFCVPCCVQWMFWLWCCSLQDMIWVPSSWKLISAILRSQNCSPSIAHECLMPEPPLPTTQKSNSILTAYFYTTHAIEVSFVSQIKYWMIQYFPLFLVLMKQVFS